ncbi:MAG: COR domain-containing protein [Bacteroidia bacterium]
MAAPELPSLLQQVETCLGFSFQKVIDPRQHLQKNYPDSYRAVMTVEEEMVRDWHGNTAFVDTEGRLLGINLYACNVANDRLQDMLKLAMPDLQALNLNQTGLASFTFTDRQPALVHVNLSLNEKLTAVGFEYAPAHLKSLDLYNCQVASLTLPAGLDNLERLDTARNKTLNQLIFEGVCPLLGMMDISENALAELVIPAGFGALKILFLRKNKLAKLVFEGSLPLLETLDVRENQLKELPDRLITQAAGLTHLFLYNNPWESIKDAVSSDERGNSRESVFSFLTSLQGEVDYLFEAKMILVGNGEVGKTSIRLKLIDEKAELPKKGDRTPGIEIDRYIVESISTAITKLETPIDFQLNIWDFGGQGKYREVQQLFCSHKSLYLFVTAFDDLPEQKMDKEDYVSFEYWLDMVSAFGYDQDMDQFSPIILVINKIDLQSHSIKKGFYLDDFAHIHQEEIHISCETLENFSRLKETIRKLIPRISKDVFTTQRNRKWLAVKKELEDRKNENYLSLSEYLKMCKSFGLDETDARTWIGMLDRIGTVIYFGQHSELKDWIVLDPEWVRDSMFKVIDSNAMKFGKGVLTPDMYDSIWPDNSIQEQEKFVNL